MKNIMIVVLVLIFLGVGGYYLMNRRQDTTMPEPYSEPVIEESMITPQEAKEFTLDSFEFGYDRKTLTVQKGDTVTITLTNSGKMPHDWIVDEFTGAKTKQIKNGETDTITFVADTAGEYEFYCSVGKHRAQGMVGTLTVVE